MSEPARPIEEEAEEAQEAQEADAERLEHAPGELEIPAAVTVLEGEAAGPRPVAIVVARFNGEYTSRMLTRALEELEAAGVPENQVTVVPVPGAFELPLGALAVAKTRRYACVIALGCVIRGETPHSELIAAEAASGLQLAALETGIPVAFGILTVENAAQAEARIDRAADAVRAALEMADLFAQIRANATQAG